MADVLFYIDRIPDQVVNERAAFGPLDLTQYIQSPREESGSLTFSAELSTGDALPKGLICTSNGIVSGIPAEGTHGSYTVLISGQDQAGQSFSAQFDLKIRAKMVMEPPEFYTELKSRVWEALKNDLPLPDVSALLNRPVTPEDIAYFLQRFATLAIWDVYNLDAPGDKQPLTLPGASKHYHIYDRGSCLVGSPKELFSHERTLEDALQTARVMAQEAFRRGWVVEFAGFSKMMRAAWIELQVLANKHGKIVEILHYTPTEEDMKLYAARAKGPDFTV